MKYVKLILIVSYPIYYHVQIVPDNSWIVENGWVGQVSALL